MEKIKLFAGDQVLRTSTLIQDLPEGAPGNRSQEHPERGEVREDLRGDSDGSQPARLIPDEGHHVESGVPIFEQKNTSGLMQMVR